MKKCREAQTADPKAKHYVDILMSSVEYDTFVKLMRIMRWVLYTPLYTRLSIYTSLYVHVSIYTSLYTFLSTHVCLSSCAHCQHYETPLPFNLSCIFSLFSPPPTYTHIHSYTLIYTHIHLYTHRPIAERKKAEAKGAGADGKALSKEYDDGADDKGTGDGADYSAGAKGSSSDLSPAKGEK